MAYDREKEHEKDWNKKYPAYSEYQNRFLKGKFKTHGFDLIINEPKEKRLKMNHINTGSGFETASVEFKGYNVARIYPSFDNSWSLPRPKIEYLWIVFNWRDILGGINYARERNGLTEIHFQKENQTLQECLDEMEKIRKEIGKFFHQNKFGSVE